MKNTVFKNKKITFTRTGSGDTLILLHGFLESHTMWDALIPKLAEHFDVIAIDLPGHGTSETIADVHTMELMAEAVNAVLQFEQVEKAHFVGHSMGGYVSLAFAELFPQKMNSLVLLNSTPLDDSITRKENRERAIVLIKKYPEAFVSMGVTNLFSSENSKIYLKEIQQTKKEALTFPIDGVVANIKGMKVRETRLEILKAFSRKKAIIAGVDDPIITIESLREISAEANTTLFEVNGGHMSHIEAKDNVLSLLLKFLN